MSQLTEELESLVRQNGPIRALARKLVRDADGVDDLVQEAALVALRRSESVRGPFGPWMGGVVRKLAANLRRSVGRTAARETDVARSEPGAATSAVETAERMEQHRRLIGAVLVLEEPFRSAILLRFFEDLPQRVIAKRLGVPSATVNSRLTRALAKLRDVLDEREGGRAAWATAFTPLLKAPWLPMPVILGAVAMKTKLGVAVAVTAALIWWVWHESAERLHADHGAVGASGVAEARLGAGAAPVTERSATGVPIATTPFAEDGQLPTEGAKRPSVTVLVKDLDGQPVAGAEVLLFEDFLILENTSGGSESLSLIGRARYDPAVPLPLDVGSRASTDSLGTARLPVPRGFARVIARSANLAGDKTPGFCREEGTIEVSLVPIEPLNVRVTDSEGGPLGGIPVSVRMITQDQRHDQPSAVTGTDGRARLGWSPKSACLESAFRDYAVALAFPLASFVETVLDPRHPPSEAITLVCPPTGSVAVDVTDGAGGPAPDGTGVMLSPLAQGGVRTIGMVLREDVRGGQALFPVVGLGLQLEARIALREHQHAAVAIVSGPKIAHDTARVALTLDLRRFVLKGRLLRGDHSPRGEAMLNITASDPGPPESTPSWRARTDRDGRFEVPAADLAGSPVVGPLTLQLWAERPTTSVELALPEGARPAAIDLGDIVVKDVEPLATGDVVDGGGRPVPGAIVKLVKPVDRAGQERQWIPAGRASKPTDSEGRFELFGTAAAEVWLTARDAAGTMRHQPVALQGPGPYRLVLELAASFEGRFLAPGGFPFRRVHAGLWSDAKGPPKSMSLAGWILGDVKGDGTVVFQDLDSGVYTFGIHTGTDEAAMLLTEIRVGSGAANRDARLDPLDLATVFRVITLSVKDDAGRALRADAFAFFEGGEVAQIGRADGALLISRREPLTTVIVEAEGTFARSLGAVDGEHEVVLSRGIALPMIWPENVSLPAAPVTIRISLVSDGPAGTVPGGAQAAEYLRRWSASLADIPAGGRVEVRAPAAGVYRVRLVARKDCGGWTDEREFTRAPPQLVVVTDSAAAPPLPIDVDPALLERALTTLGKR